MIRSVKKIYFKVTVRIAFLRQDVGSAAKTAKFTIKHKILSMRQLLDFTDSEAWKEPVNKTRLRRYRNAITPQMHCLLILKTLPVHRKRLASTQ